MQCVVDGAHGLVGVVLRSKKPLMIAVSLKATRLQIGLDRRSVRCPCEQIGYVTFMAERLDVVVARESGGSARRWVLSH